MKVMITTIDNPFNPFKDFKSWFAFDVMHGYNTCSHLARIARTSDELTEFENEIELENAIDEMIEYDFMNVYIKIKENDLDVEDDEE